MRTIRVHGASVEGSEAFVVTIEARFDASSGEGKGTDVHLTGLPDPILRESRGRLLATLRSAGLWLPSGRLFLNLVPAGRKKSGEGLDLALVLAAATAAGHLAPRASESALFLGEVGLDGRLHAVPGGLAATVAARGRGLVEIVAPPATATEAAALDDVAAYGAERLADVLAHLTHTESPLQRLAAPAACATNGRDPARVDDVRGQTEGKLALQIAAAGGHGLLFVGPPGAGKSMLARRLIDLLPAMSLPERIEVTTILSATGRWPQGLSTRRPFRAPHHTTSFAGLVGGGSPIAPGEITLAHGGVLFLDELPEFGRDALEGLRQPLEAGEVQIGRAARHVTLPARFQLVAAMNPCPCGYHGHPKVPCHCSPGAVHRYRQRISGPLLDRIDLRVALQPSPVGVLIGAASGAAATTNRGDGAGSHGGAEVPRGVDMGAAVEAARARMAARGTVDNAGLDAALLDRLAPLTPPARETLERAAERAVLSARAIQSIRRVARTVADLAGRDGVDERDVGMALALRGGLA